MATIYRKSAKGQTEIETRAHGLAPRFRSLLILVDGRRSDDELSRLMPQAGIEALQALAEGGFIEAIGVTAEPAPSPRPPAPPPPPAPPAANLATQRREAVRALTDLVGPMAEALAMRIERVQDEAEFRRLVQTAGQVIANTRGRAVADTFVQRFTGS